jgi:hypothetical protein
MHLKAFARCELRGLAASFHVLNDHIFRLINFYELLKSKKY